MSDVNKLSLLFWFSLLSFLLCLSSIFIAFFTNPQVGHSINLISLLLTAMCWVQLFIPFRGFSQRLSRPLFYVTSVFIVVNILLFFQFAFSKYGFSYWHYTSWFTLESN